MDTQVPRFSRVYLVDDHDIVRRGLRDLLVDANDIQVVGDSGSAREAIPEILRLEVDVMLLDLQLQDGSGIEVCRAVRSVKPAVSGLLLTASGHDEALAATVLAGATGYLVKLSRSTDIVGTIRRLGAGTTLVDPASAERAAQLLGWLVASLTPGLTEHEQLILQLVIDGQTDSQIADRLAIDRATDPASRSDVAGGVEGDVEGLVARVTQVLLTQGGLPGGFGSGRHRRTD